MNKGITRASLIQVAILASIAMVVLLAITLFRTPIIHFMMGHQGATQASTLSYFVSENPVQTSDESIPSTGCSCPNCCPVTSSL